MIRSKILSVQIVILIVLGVTACSSSPGIESPITIDGTDFQITSASIQESYQGTYRPNSDNDAFLIVLAEISSTEDDVDFSDWAPEVQDENGRIDSVSISYELSGTVNGQEGDFLEWAFVVDKDAQSFTLVMREYEIVLDSILED
jgi:hypothetical protein